MRPLRQKGPVNGALTIAYRSPQSIAILKSRPVPVALKNSRINKRKTFLLGSLLLMILPPLTRKISPKAYQKEQEASRG